MYILKATSRNRNDFHFVAMCRSCGKKSRWGDGYADAYYQTKVFPARHCPHCGVNEYGVSVDPPDDSKIPIPLVCEYASMVGTRRITASTTEVEHDTFNNGIPAPAPTQARDRR